MIPTTDRDLDAEDRRVAAALAAGGLDPRARVVTARQAAAHLIMLYVARGDSVEDLAAGGMGAGGRAWCAQIGGYLRSHDNTRLIRTIDCWHIGVTDVAGVACLEVFPLRTVYDELYQRMFVARQLPLFQEVTS